MKINRPFVASLLAASAMVAATPAQAQRVDNIVVFGDSYADTGNAVTMILANPATPLPVKQQIQTVYPTGRFSGGTNYIDTLSDLTGATIENYAVGGALAGTGNVNTGLPGFTQETQIFLSGTVPPGTPFPVSDRVFGENDLLAVSVGGNDARAYQLGGGDLAGAAAAGVATAATATANLDQLVAAGARTISFLAGDTAALPEVLGNANAQGIRSAFSTSYNAAMQPTLAGYAANGVIVHYLDGATLFSQLAANPAAYGIDHLYCPAFPDPTCIVNAGGYLFYGDGVHLTSDGFQIVGQYIATQLTAPLVLQGASDLSMDVARQFGRTLTTRMDLGSPRDGETLDGLRLFAVGDGYTRKLNAGPRNNAYRASGVGATIGAEYGFGTGVAGVAINYTKPKVNFTSDAADNKGHSVQLGGYAAFGIAGGFAQGYAGYGWDKHDIARAGVVEDMDADPKGHHFVAGAKAGYLMPMWGMRLGPVIALDYAKAKVDGYTESGDPVLTLNVGSLSYRSLRGSAGIELRGDFGDEGGKWRPYASAVVEKDFTGDGRTIRFAQTSAPTIVNSFALEDTSKKAYGRVSLGLSAEVVSHLSLDVGGSATISKDQGDEASAQLGLRFAL